ncbi:serine protein kinase RIO [Candidatus Micrarchaeota archaeon]|jgi:RIO kinase 1|nr:serine protein kinase RIO [Candidatus Micrarchaeota archaeon]
MAIRKSKTKAPAREKKQYKQKRMIESQVFDIPTLKELSRLIGKRIFDTLDHPIAIGKEAKVFRATKESVNGKKTYLAVKIYRIETSSFDKMMDYLKGDARFNKVKNKKLDIIKTWTRKEYTNLRLAYGAKIHVPKPIGYARNVLIMHFLGEKGKPYPTLHDYGPINPKEDFNQLLVDIRKLYTLGLVHGDLSPFNILQTPKGLYMIDMGQAVILKHPKAQEFLERDVRNILKYFKKYGIKKSEEEMIKYIKQK